MYLLLYKSSITPTSISYFSPGFRRLVSQNLLLVEAEEDEEEEEEEAEEEKVLVLCSTNPFLDGKNDSSHPKTSPFEAKTLIRSKQNDAKKFPRVRTLNDFMVLLKFFLPY